MARDPLPEAMDPPGVYIWPVSYRWTTRCSWGSTQQIVSLDAPELEGDAAATRKLGELLWQLMIAPAISISCELVTVETVAWKSFQVPVPFPVMNGRGTRFSLPASRDNSACLVMHTGHMDAFARRRLYLPGIPRNWVEGGLLTVEGMGEIEAHAQSIVMGMLNIAAGGKFIWLNAYPDALPNDLGNPLGVGFRMVDRVRVCHHTDRAPEPSSELWP